MKLTVKLFLILLVIFISGCSSDKLSDATVTVNGGVAQGLVEDGIAVFRGIPFAAPPVGDLRWKAPQLVQSWDGVFKADKFAPASIQPPVPWMGEIKTSEDCLFLNVWTPAKSKKEKLPVMVWIYGGGFAMGATSAPVYYGDQIAKNGVILVSVAYRLGALGFLAHPELTAESEKKVSGNYGLLDQIAGLKWVQENIEVFGGDPAKVTIFGESAGAISVSMLCASPLATGLFTGAISESGGSFSPVSDQRSSGDVMQTLAEAEKSGAEFVKRMGAITIADMRAMPPEQWLGDPQSQMGGFWPVVDGYVIAGDQYRLYEEGNFNDVNVIIGTNSDEGSYFARPMEPAVFLENMKLRFGPLAEKALELYPGSSAMETYTSGADIFREAMFAWPSYAWARLQSKTGKSKVFTYYFDQFRPEPVYPDGPVPRGAAHSTEMAYVFGHLAQNPETKVDGEEEALADIMIKYWTNFAKTGDPNGEGLPVWPVFRDGEKTVMYLKGTESRPIDIPNLDKLLFMDEYFAWLRGN
jgi:para-nitrobenzyl esterase